VRARRRAIQDVTLGKEDVDVDRTESALRARDTKDSSRAASPLAQAQDAVLLDTTDLSLDQVVDQLVGMVEELPRT
jgi:cytidylate kinase